MPKIYFTGFGRGSTSFDKTDIESAYNSVVTLINTTKLGDDNLSDNAGIPESWFEFDSLDEGHTHMDGSLGDMVVGSVCIDVSSPPKKFTFTGIRTEWGLSQCPGTKLMVGETVPFPLIRGHEVTCYFGEGVVKASPFAPGSTPVVILLPCSYNDSSDGLSSNTVACQFRLVVKEVTDTYFTFIVYVNTDESSYLGYFVSAYYVAVATAPGYLTPIGGV